MKFPLYTGLIAALATDSLSTAVSDQPGASDKSTIVSTADHLPSSLMAA